MGQPGGWSAGRGAASGEATTTGWRPARRGAPGPGAAAAAGSGGSSGGGAEGPGEKARGSHEEAGDGSAALEGPGSSEERNNVVEDWESDVLGSESVKKERRERHSGTVGVCHLCAPLHAGCTGTEKEGGNVLPTPDVQSSKRDWVT